MPNIVSAKKRVQVTKVKTARNNVVKTTYKTAVRKFNEAVEAENTELANETFKNAVAKIDMAKSKGVLKANTASRKKSTLAKKLNNLAK